MAKVWVKLLTVKSVPGSGGVLKTCQPGEFVEVGKHTARKWIAEKTATIPDLMKDRTIEDGDLTGCGVLVRGDTSDGRAVVGRFKVPIERGALRVPFERTFIYHPRVKPTPRQVTFGFTKLEKQQGYDAWDMALMVRGRKMLALRVGSKADKAATEELVGTLHLPVYETGAVWVRKTDDTEAMIAKWCGLMDEGVGEEHAFLQALYTSPLKVCSLPAQWLTNWYVEEKRKKR